MNREIAVLAVWCALVSPPGADAQADEFCDSLTAVGNEAATKFHRLRAGPDDTGDYRSSVTLPGAKECYIDREDSEFHCTWQLTFSSDLEKEAKAFATGIQNCFPNGKFIHLSNFYVLHFNGVAFRVRQNPKRHRVYLDVYRDD